MKTFILDDYTLKIGNNAKENDELLSQASQNDLWLHLAKFSSPHGILSGDIQNINKQTLTWAATLVKESSARRCRNLNNIEVNYLPVKHVQKTEECGKVILLKKSGKIKV